MTVGGWVLAHQGGWDEALFFLTPFALFWGLYRVAVSRAAKAEAERRDVHHGHGSDSPAAGRT